MSLSSRTSVRVRLFLLAGTLGALLLTLAVVAITGFSNIKSAYTAYQLPRQQRDYATAAYEGWQQADDQMHTYAALAELHDPRQASLMNATWDQVLQGQQQITKNFVLLKATPMTPRSEALFKTLEREVPTYSSWTTLMYDTLQSGSSAMAAVRDITVDNASISNRVRTGFNDLRALLEANEAMIGARIPSTTDRELTLMIVISIVALLLAMAITWLIVRSIIRPLDKVRRAAYSVANGHVDVDMDVSGRDEIAKVAKSFRGVIDHLASMSAVAREFANGNLRVPVTPKSDGDVLGHAFVELQSQMSAALGERSTAHQLESGMGELLEAMQRLDQGLSAMEQGNLTVDVDAALTPVTARDGSEALGFVADRYNEMLTSAQSSLESYNSMRETLREKLGDQSSLEALSERMDSLTNSSLAELQSAMRAMNDGNLTINVTTEIDRIDVQDGRELGQLAEVFNAMLDNTRGAISSYNDMRAKIAAMLNEISTSSESLSAASSQMASTSEEAGRAIAEIAHAVGSVAQGAEQQVRSVDDAKRITDELAQASIVSAQTAEETAAAAEGARILAREGVDAADNAAQAMQAVRDSSTQVSEAIRALGEKSDQIGGIVATITGIAAQTNLLALNAAIEAARAGEHGRGFAVVAEEVRHLAEESQQAAASIGGLIEEIQHETARAVEVVEVGAQQTHGGVETVEQAREAFLRIGQSVEDMSTRVEEIAASIRQIAASGDQMRDSMNSVAAVAEQSSASTQQVSASTEQSSASTQQIAASAQQLAATAEELEKLVGQFVLA